MIDIRKSAMSTAARLFSRIISNNRTQAAIFNAIRLNRPEASGLIADDDVRFLSYCLSRRARSRSQIMQDLWVCFELGEKRDGFFVEFGATNGLTNSNTWFLEHGLGWTGILAEPNPVWHEDLAVNRQARIEHRCVSSTSGETVTFIATDDSDPELSAIADFSRGDHFAGVREKGRRIQVETISLDDLLDQYDAPAEIDYISIDTEGSEYDILSAYSFKRRFRLISVENNRQTERGIQTLLESKGYRRVFGQFSQWDGWYVSGDLPHSDEPIYAPSS